MLFETRAGPLRLRWNERGLTAIEMPELPPRALRAELAKQHGAEVPPFAREAARLLERHLAGEGQDLAALPLDLSVLAPFQRAVYEKVRDLPRAGLPPTGRSPRCWESPARREPWARRSGAIRSWSQSLATACSPPAAPQEDFRLRAA